MNQINYVPLEEKLFTRVIELIDNESGKGFYSHADLTSYLKQSTVEGKCSSFVALDGKKVVGLRLTLADPSWRQDFDGKLSPNNWPSQLQKVAYFKSNFISESYRGKGVGSTLSKHSLKVLKELDYQAVLAHSWLESPGNSSQKYLNKLGFTAITEHKKFWYEVDYECVRCHPGKCICSAMEMLLVL